MAKLRSKVKQPKEQFKRSVTRSVGGDIGIYIILAIFGVIKMCIRDSMAEVVNADVVNRLQIEEILPVFIGSNFVYTVRKPLLDGRRGNHLLRHIRMRAVLLNAADVICVRRIRPVAYTHLDVYKRQQ